MEPLTHALASLALARAGLGRAAPRATPMLLVSGVAADLDWISYAGGAGAYLAWHRAASHSLVGAAVITLGTAVAFWRIQRRGKNRAAAIRLGPALVICAIGAASHVLIDLADGYGVKLLWPFSQRWYAGDLALSLDPWLIALLLAALLLPMLFRMVGAEIGARSRPKRLDWGVIVFLLLSVLYCGARGAFHGQALAKLRSRRYQGAEPILAGAFPTLTPFEWRGLLDTGNALQQIEVPIAASETFDPDRARSYYKPMDSPMLDRARQTDSVRALLAFARFPLATIEPSQNGYVVRIRDLRLDSGLAGEREVEAIINLDEQSQVTSSRLDFAGHTPTGAP